MANEISNRAQAAALVQFFPGAPPLFLGGWGVKPATLRRLTVAPFAVGSYMIDLEQPGSGVIAADIISGFVSLAQIVTSSDIASAGGRVVVGLTNDPTLPAVPFVGGKSINLASILMRVIDNAGTSVDGQGAISVLVHAIPTQV